RAHRPHPSGGVRERALCHALPHERSSGAEVEPPLRAALGVTALTDCGTAGVEMPRYIGKPVPRLEDERFITGAGRYTNDIPPPNALWSCVLRSPHAHARIAGIKIDAARGMPGVFAVLIAADYAADGGKGI